MGIRSDPPSQPPPAAPSRAANRLDGAAETNTLLVTIFTLASRVLGFFRIAIISAIFGASGSADVLNLVLQLPNNLRRLLAEGALSSAFIPVLNQSIHSDQPHIQTTSAKKLFETIIGAQILFFVPLLVLATLFARPIAVVLYDFQSAELQELSVNLFRWLIWYIFPISVGAIFMAVCNSHGHFVISSLTPIISSVIVIGATLLFSGRVGIFAVGGGVLVGGVMHIVVQLPRVLRLGYRLRARCNFADPGFRRIMRNWGPIVLTSSLFAINQQIAVYFASGLETGSGSVMIYALTFWQLPFGILVVSVLTVLYPRMSKECTLRDYGKLADTYLYGVRYLLHVMLPATLYLIFMSDPLVRLALLRGALTAEDAANIARVLRAYSYGLIGVALYQFFQRYYYANQNLRVPIIILLITVAVDVGLSLWLKEILGVTGLGIANSGAFLLGALFLTISSRRHLRSRTESPVKIFAGIWKVAGALIIPVLFLYTYQRMFTRLFAHVSTALELVIFIFATGVFAFLTLLLYNLCGVEPVPMKILRQKRKSA